MIEAFREKMQGIFATVVIVFICVVFALWGVESLFNRNAAAKVPLTVDGVDISEMQINQAVNMARQRYGEIFKGKVDPSFLTDKMLREPAIESLIGRTLLEKQVAQMKMLAAPSSIDREIVRNPEFSQDGQHFDADFFKEKLRTAGMTPAIYRSRLNDALIMEQLQRGIADSAFVTTKQINAAAALAEQGRTFEYVKMPIQDAINTIHPDDKVVEQYFKEHASAFMTDETVALEYLDLSKDNLARQATVSDSELRESYDKEAANFKPAIERRAAHILIEEKKDGSAKTKLDDIVKKLKSGGDFASLAKKYSDDKESAAVGGDVGVSTGNVFEPEFEQALASLVNVGDVSEPVKTRYGYHIIKLLDKKDSAFPSFAERKAELEKQLRNTKADALYAEKLAQMTESTYSAGDLIGPAAELKLDIQKTAPFGRRGGAGIAAQQKVIDAAFSQNLLDSGGNSQVIELSADRAVVVRVTNHQLPKPRELAEVKQTIIETIKKSQAATSLKEKAETIRSRVVAGESVKAAVGQEKLPIALLENQKITAAGEQGELVAEAFRLSGKPTDASSVAAVQLGNGDWAVLHLLAINTVEPDKNSTEYQALDKKMNASVGEEDFSLYQQGLRQSAKIVRKDSPDKKEDDQQ